MISRSELNSPTGEFFFAARLENFRISGKYCGEGKTNENFSGKSAPTYTYYVYVGLVLLKLQKKFFEICTNFFRAVLAKVYIKAYTGTYKYNI